LASKISSFEVRALSGYVKLELSTSRIPAPNRAGIPPVVSSQEWRHVGEFYLCTPLIMICPESEHPRFYKLLEADNYLKDSHIIDCNWSLEEIIADLANFRQTDIRFI
jgi:hypothetical protein